MPTSQYATRSDSVLAWKKANKLGRFDPHAAEVEAAKKEVAEREIRERGQLLSPFRSNYHSHSVSLPLHPRVSACFVVYRTSYLNQPFLLLPSHLSHLQNSKQRPAPDVHRRSESTSNHHHQPGIALHKRCILLPPPPPTSLPSSHPSERDTSRRGTILYIGPLPSRTQPQNPSSSTPDTDPDSAPKPPQTQIPWIGIALDEPQGRNDGTLNGERHFECKAGHGVFVRPERVEVGDWGVLDLEADEGLDDEGDGDMEEI